MNLFEGEKRTKICKYEQMDFFRADLRGQKVQKTPKPPLASLEQPFPIALFARDIIAA